MKLKLPKNDKKYIWTNHVVGKMLYYKISEGLVKRVIKNPHRAEEGIAPGTIAVMQKAGTAKNPKEVWVMYAKEGTRKIIITAWRYPGISPIREQIPIPNDILEELSSEFDINFSSLN